MDRREFLSLLGAGALSGLLPGVSFAKAKGNKRLVVVILRGGMDGLAAVAPFGDPSYKTARRGLALPGPRELGGVLPLDRTFGLHPAMDELHDLYQAKELAVIPAVAIPTRTRSHFSAQDILENGMTSENQRSGWLNRALAEINSPSNKAIAFNEQVPLILHGDMKVTSWAPSRKKKKRSGSFMEKMQDLYADDKKLGSALKEGFKAESMASKVMSMEDPKANKRAARAEEFSSIANVCGKFLSEKDGPRIATLEVGGWDTHANQGKENGLLANKLGLLSQGIFGLKQSLGNHWKDTMVVVVTEFGRTVAMNGTNGTDHGTGSIAFMAGGSIKGGKVYGRWPGLHSDGLYQGRDVAATTDMRSIFKTALAEQFNLSNSSLTRVFPESNKARIISGLI